MRRKSTTYFNTHDTNTICDITGFKVKKSQTRKRWDGFQVIAEAWHPRHPQDFPVIPIPQKIIKDVRAQDLATDPIQTFTTI